jgi:DNA-binding transcriptional MerR regulator
MNSNTDIKHTVDDLARLTETPVRTIRYYIQIGLIDRPVGEKRSAYYTAQHVDQLLTIRKWQAAGLSLERIKEILSESSSGLLPPAKPRSPGTLEVWSHLIIADGVEMTIEPGRANLSPEQLRTFALGVMALYQQTTQMDNEKDANHD